MVYFQANTESPIFSELRGLLVKTAGLVDVLADALKPLIAKLRLVFVYGSIASGSEQSESDIDLMVIGTVSPVELSIALRHARATCLGARSTQRSTRRLSLTENERLRIIL